MLIGKAAVWGLAVDGEEGVVRVLDILRGELENVMILAGCQAISDITDELIARAGRAG